MRMTLRDVRPIEEGFHRLRQAPLQAAGEQNIFVYKDARMRIGEFYADEINPMSFYVLKDHLQFLKALREDLWDRYKIDILRLKSILHLEDENGEIIGMAPPVVEVYDEMVRIWQKEGTRQAPEMLDIKVPILYDGIHRAWLAREEKEVFSCIVISGALPERKPYGYPNTWEDVKVCEEKPAIKKNYRRKEAYSFMRPLSVLRDVGSASATHEWGR